MRYIKLVLDEVFEQLTAFGGLVFYGLLCLFFFMLGKIELLIYLILSFIINMSLAIFIKYFFFKDRPVKMKMKRKIDRLYASTFPSIHSMRSASIVFWMIVYFPKTINILLFCSIGLLVMYSRIYLKKHYFKDVFFGLIFSLIINYALLIL